MTRFRNSTNWFLPGFALAGVVGLAVVARCPGPAAGRKPIRRFCPRSRSRRPPTSRRSIGADEGRQAGHRQEARRDARGPLRPRRPRRCGREDDARQGRAAGPARETCRTARPGPTRPAMTPDEIREKGLFPAGFLPAAAPEPSRRRDALPEVPHRRDQEAGGPRPHALRPRLRPARPPAARVPAADLPDHAAPTSATSPRASSSPSTTSRSCSRTS